MPRIPETKPFYLTSEFWATVALQIACIGGVLPGGSKITGIVMGVSAAAYALARGLAKSGVTPGVDSSLTGDPDDTAGAEDQPTQIGDVLQ